MNEPATGTMEQGAPSHRATLEIYLRLLRSIDEQRSRLAWSALFTWVLVSILAAA